MFDKAIDWDAVDKALGIERDEDGKYKTEEDWLRAGAYAFSQDDDISMFVMSPDNPEETFDALHDALEE